MKPLRFPIIVLPGVLTHRDAGLTPEIAGVDLNSMAQFSDFGSYTRAKLLGEIPMNAPYLLDCLRTFNEACDAIEFIIGGGQPCTVFLVCPRRNSNGKNTVQRGVYDRQAYDRRGFRNTLTAFFVPRPKPSLR